MALFFIEMHQGIVARPELRVCTSQLASCTLITGYNAAQSLGGAYHYPAECRGNHEVLAVMEQWWHCLQPSQVTLVFAVVDQLQPQYTTSEEDIAFLTRWVRAKGVQAGTARSRAAAMSVSATGTFTAGEAVQIPGNFETGRIDVSNSLPGRHEAHGGFTLFDSDIAHVTSLNILVY